jgi:hypothetical protein
MYLWAACTPARAARMFVSYYSCLVSIYAYPPPRTPPPQMPVDSPLIPSRGGVRGRGGHSPHAASFKRRIKRSLPNRTDVSKSSKTDFKKGFELGTSLAAGQLIRYGGKTPCVAKHAEVAGEAAWYVFIMRLHTHACGIHNKQGGILM